MTTTRIFLIAALGLGLLGSTHAADPPNITLELRDAPLRAALEQLFDAAGLQYQIDNDVRGFTTLKIREQPLESALKLLLRSGTQPLTYKIENGVYQVSVRRLSVASPEPPAPTLPEEAGTKWEFISLTYLDPMALTPFVGPILEVDHFRRWRQGQGQNQGAPGATGSGAGNRAGNASGSVGNGTLFGFPGGIAASGGGAPPSPSRRN
jgi:type II secretory pathway component GspD/PulD (secretin)